MACQCLVDPEQVEIDLLHGLLELCEATLLQLLPFLLQPALSSNLCWWTATYCLRLRDEPQAETTDLHVNNVYMDAEGFKAGLHVTGAVSGMRKPSLHRVAHWQIAVFMAKQATEGEWLCFHRRWTHVCHHHNVVMPQEWYAFGLG